MDNAEARRLVDARVAEALAILAADVVAVGDAAADLVEPLGALAARGKRVRAALLLAAHEAAGGTAHSEAVGVATALELFQTAALVHDDVLDRSDTRRGMPAAHRAIEAIHARDGLEGDAGRYGVNGAILAGDLALMACLGELASASAALPAETGHAVSGRFRYMASLCTAGQYLDVRLAATPLTELAAMRDAIVAVMRSKTASYTAEGPLALGAAVAGRSHAEVDAWAAAGVPLGIAFQLRDDLLGVLGSEHQTGKPAGDDLREGKRTILLAEALARGSGPAREAILAVAGVADADEAAVHRAKDAVVASGAVEAVESEIAAYGDRARRAVAELVEPGPHGDHVKQLIDAALDRDA